MKTNRRTMVIGLGALALGSGAVFSSAAFQSMTSPDADFRLVVDERLLVQAGASFRDDTSPSGNFDPNTDKTKFKGFEGDLSQAPIFGDESGFVGGFTAFDLPKMAVNEKSNEDLVAQVGTRNEEGIFEFENSLQINSQSNTPVRIAIEIKDYGAQGDGSDGSDSTGDYISRERVRDIYSFYLAEDDGSLIPDSSVQRISTAGSDSTGAIDGSDFSGTAAANDITVGPGSIHQLRLDVDLDDSSTRTRLAGIAGDGSSGTFDDEAFAALNLVDTIEVGVVERNPSPTVSEFYLEFDGVDDHVRVDNGALNQVQLNEPFSISTWVRSDSSSSSAVITTQNDNDANAQGVQLGYSTVSEGFLFRLADGSDRIQVEESVDSADGDWHHIVVTYDGSEDAGGIEFYVDGSEVGSTSHNEDVSEIQNVGDTYFGIRDGSGIPYDGDLDDIRFYDRVLSQSEINDLDDRYASVASGDLIGWYPLNEGEDGQAPGGADVEDLSDEDNHGDNEGAEWRPL